MIDPAAATAYQSPERVQLRTFRCPGKNGKCRNIMGALWSTPAGRVLSWSAPNGALDPETRRAAIAEGIKTHRDPSALHIRFLSDVHDAELEMVCGKCGTSRFSVHG